MDRDLDQLEHLMARLVEEHRELLGLVRRKREAMRLGKPGLIADCCAGENLHVQLIGEVEKERQRVVGRLTERWAVSAERPLRLGEIAERAGEPRRGRLLVMQGEAMGLMETIRRENDVVKRATEGLIRHVQGMVQQVTAAVTGAGVYGRGGKVAAPATAVSSFSITG